MKLSFSECRRVYNKVWNANVSVDMNISDNVWYRVHKDIRNGLWDIGACDVRASTVNRSIDTLKRAYETV